jgi:hypothetical protein
VSISNISNIKTNIILINLGYFFPGRPIIRKVKLITFGSGSEVRCSKNYQSSSRLGGGIVLFWCATHRICLGWIFLQSAESLEVIYSAILSRFRIIPKIICYDNACNLADYCYNRAPR